MLMCDEKRFSDRNDHVLRGVTAAAVGCRATAAVACSAFKHISVLSFVPLAYTDGYHLPPCLIVSGKNITRT